MTMGRLCILLLLAILSEVGTLSDIGRPAAAQADRFESAGAPTPPRPRAIKPAYVPAPRDAPAPQPEPFDGLWVGTYSCIQYGTRPGFSYELRMEVKHSRLNRLHAGPQAPAPGYDNYEGVVGPDGRVSILRNAVGLGITPGAAAHGDPITVRFEGQFSGNSFVARQISRRPRCSIQLVRRQ
jgi:hypothetical protein